nr:hypothetical protein Iba_chr11eCG16710 [Ipomoea batatas]
MNIIGGTQNARASSQKQNSQREQGSQRQRRFYRKANGCLRNSERINYGTRQGKEGRLKKRSRCVCVPCKNHQSLDAFLSPCLVISTMHVNGMNSVNILSPVSSEYLCPLCNSSLSRSLYSSASAHPRSETPEHQRAMDGGNS